MSPILVQNTTEVAKLSSCANIISRPLAKMRARPATTQRCTLARRASSWDQSGVAGESRSAARSAATATPPPTRMPKMEIGHRGAHGRVAIQVRPPREELRYCRRRCHGVVLLKGFGSAISRCPDHRYAARIPAGILPWRPESCSRGPTDESGHAVIEWLVKALFSLSATCSTTGVIPAPPIEGARFGPTPARPHGAPAAPSRFRCVVEHQPTARVRTLAEPAGIAAHEQLRR